jgi:nucleoside-diphosphate-sugar epimerase
MCLSKNKIELAEKACTSSERHALVIGVTGIQGNVLASQLVENGWKVTGLARRTEIEIPGVSPVSVDLSDADAVIDALRDVHPSHVFFNAWSRQPTEAENCVVNGGMLRNLLQAVEPGPRLEHVSLVTGLKHYLGPFEAYALIKPDTPFREEQERLPYENFYYTQEDILFESAARAGFSWSVHRPHTVIGWAIGNAMNMGVTLAVYASSCRETGRPFVFPGSPEQFDAATDVTDSRILARQLEWAATTPAAANQAFNIVNGDIFRWRRMWSVIAEDLCVEPAPYPGKPTPLVEQMKNIEPIWKGIVKKHNLQPYPIDKLASWWHSDADLGRQIEAFTDVSKSRRLGFLEYQETSDSFRDLFNRLRAERIIPPRS